MGTGGDWRVFERGRRGRLLLASLVAALLVCVAYSVLNAWARDADPENADLPFGVSWDDASQKYLLIDFAAHFHYCQAIWRGVHPRPYSLEGQKALFRDWTDVIHAGMPFAYSPVLVAQARPFLLVDARAAFVGFSLLNALLLAALVRFYLTPHLADNWQTAQVAAALLSLSMFSTFLIGQTSIVTTAALASTWALLTRTGKRAGWEQPALGALLWLLSAKPSVGIVAVCWLLAFRAWGALAVGAVLCAASTLYVAPLLGGWPQWVEDYLSLLGNYHQDGVGAFMSPGLSPRILTNLFGFLVQTWGLPAAAAARICRNSSLIGLAALAALAAWRWLSPADLLRLSIGGSLVFSPHVTAPEDWLLVLAVAERRDRQSATEGVLLLLAVLIAVNLRQGVGAESFAMALLGKMALLAHWIGDAVKHRSAPRDRGGARAGRLANDPR